MVRDYNPNVDLVQRAKAAGRLPSEQSRMEFAEGRREGPYEATVTPLTSGPAAA